MSQVIWFGVIPMPQESNVDWSAIRSEFPTTEKFCYLNLANKAILPKSVQKAMESWIDLLPEMSQAKSA